MAESSRYQLLADAVLTLHLGIVVFVIGGLALVVAGNRFGWRWVNRLWFRLAHLAAIGIVVAESWAGVVCPLTTWEMWLRAKAGAATYGTGFIEHWVQRLLYYDAPPWVFIAGYTLFALLVVATWWYYPPEGLRGRESPSPQPSPRRGEGANTSTRSRPGEGANPSTGPRREAEATERGLR